MERNSKKTADRRSSSVRVSVSENRSSSQSRELLLTMLEMGGVMAEIMMRPGAVLGRGTAPRKSTEAIEAQRRREYMERLKKRKLVEYRMCDNRMEYVLSGTGRAAALREAVIGCDNILDDGVHCYVSYDIPESLKDRRQQLRRFLKRSGFELVHQSLWRTEKNVAKYMNELVAGRELSRYVSVFIAQ